MARPIVDMAIDVYLSYELIRHAERAQKKYPAKIKVARRFVHMMLPRVEMNRQYAMAGERFEV